MSIEDQLSKFMTDDEKEILKSMMLKDNLYRQDIYYKKYLQQLEKKYLKKKSKYILGFVIVIVISLGVYLIYIKNVNVLSFFSSKEVLVPHESFHKTETISRDKKDLHQKVKQKTSVILKFNFGYCTDKECVVNVYNSVKKRDEYITLNIKYKEYILTLHKGVLFKLTRY